MNKDIYCSLVKFERAKKYWLNKLSGELSEVKLLRDFPATKEYAASTCKIIINKEQTAQILLIGKNNDLSLYVTLLAVLKICLYKSLNQQDIIISSPTYSLSKQEFNKFVSFREVLQPEMTFRDLLINLQTTVAEGYKNQYYPIKKIIDALDIKEGFSLFRVILLLESIHNKEFLESTIAEFKNDIIFSFNKKTKEKVLAGEVIYNSKEFKKASIERFIDWYLRILTQVLKDINVKIRDIALISEKEKHEILFHFNDYKADYPIKQTIHRLFEEQVKKTPNSIAVVFEDQQITYLELNEKANQLARALNIKGAHPGTIVGMLLDSSMELVVGILSVLKIRGAYLPVDPNYPEERQVFMIRNSNSTILLIRKTNMEKSKGLLQAFSPNNIIIIDDESNYTWDTSNLGIHDSPEDLIYIIYTSGTTGKPKGVLIQHRGVSNYIQWRLKTYHYTEKDVTLQLLSYSFDGFVSNFYSSLLSGGTLIMIPDTKRMDVEYMKKMINEKKVTNTSLVPELYKSLLSNTSQEDFQQLRFVVLAGDKAGEGLIKESMENHPGIILINEYGPTETSVTATCYYGLDETTANLIGKPIANTHIYILDRFLKYLPPGLPGELFVSGAGVGNGYLNNVELTAEKFLANPYQQNERIYRTGDLARWLPNGYIEFLGRVDNQVKIRGNRIELEDIQIQLLKQHEITEAIVTDRKDKSGNKYLCAYVVTKKFPLDVPGIKKKLSENLPGYMIPSYFVELKQLPLNLNGKINRKALPEPEITASKAYIAPRDETERKLVNIWSDVLSIDREVIGIQTNFFELGGHSLKATILTSKIKKELKVEVPLIEIFKTPTIIQISRYIKEAHTDENRMNDQNLVLLKKGKSNTDHIFFIHDATGEVEVYMGLCAYLTNDFNCWGIKSSRLKNLMPRNITINDIAKEYIKVIKKVQKSGPYHIAGWSMGGTIAYEMVRQLEESNEPIGFFAMIDTYIFQKDLSKNIKDFSFDTELEFLQNLLGNENEKVIEIIKNPIKFEEIWTRITDYFESNKNERKILDHLLEGINIRALLSNVDQLSLKERIYYINVLRSFNNAGMSYNPPGEINSLIHYFRANDTAQNQFQVPWDHHTTGSIVTHQLPGDHYSILFGPELIQLANEFSNEMNLELQSNSECIMYNTLSNQVEYRRD